METRDIFADLKEGEEPVLPTLYTETPSEIKLAVFSVGKMDALSVSLIKRSKEGDRHAVIVLENKEEGQEFSDIRSLPGLESNASPVRLKYMQDTFGEHFVVASGRRRGIIHEQAKDKITQIVPELKDLPVLEGASLTIKKEGLGLENRSGENIAFPKLDLARAFFTFKSINKNSLEGAPFSFWYVMDRSLSAAKTNKLAQLIGTATGMKCSPVNCVNIQHEEEWEKIRNIKSGEERRQLIANKIMDNIFIAAAANPNEFKSNRSDWEEELDYLLKTAEKYKIQIDLERIPKVLQEEVEGSTALILATEKGYTTNVQRLLVAGANINAKNSLGHTALYYALSKENDQITRILLDDKKLNLSVEPDVLDIAIRYNNIVAINRLIADKIPISDPIQLLTAAAGMKDETTQLNVIKHIAISSKENSTALLMHLAKTPGLFQNKETHHKVVSVLFEAGVDPNFADEKGMTPLMYASKLKFDDAVDLLLKNPQIKPLKNIALKEDLNLLNILLKPHVDRCPSPLKEIYQTNLNQNAAARALLLPLTAKFEDVKSLNDFIVTMIDNGFTPEIEQALKKMDFSEDQYKKIKDGIIIVHEQFHKNLRKEIASSVQAAKEQMLEMNIYTNTLLESEATSYAIQNIQNNFLQILFAAQKSKSKWIPELEEGYQAVLRAGNVEVMLTKIKDTIDKINKKDSILKRSASAHHLTDLVKSIEERIEEKNDINLNLKKHYKELGSIYKEASKLQARIDTTIKNVAQWEIKLNRFITEEKGVISPELTHIKSEINTIKSDIEKISKKLNLMEKNLDKLTQVTPAPDIKSKQQSAFFKPAPKTDKLPEQPPNNPLSKRRPSH